MQSEESSDQIVYTGAAGKKVERLEAIVSDDFYAALQTYKTQYARAQKKGDFPAAVDILRSGALTLLKAQRLTAGTELALLLVETLEKGDIDQCPELTQIIGDISAAFKGFANDDSCRVEAAKNEGRVLKAAIQWSTLAKHGQYETGDPTFHSMRARAMVRANDLSAAAMNYLHTGKPVEFAEFLYNLSCQGYQSERDLFLTRAVLQLLALENLKDANELYDAFCNILAKNDVPLKSTPLTNFTKFLLRTLERQAFPLFELLRNRYQQALRRDASFQLYLDRIQESFFGVKPQKRGMQAMLDNMMSMFGGAQ